MAMPAEDAYWQIGDDATRFWSSARRIYVSPSDAGLLAWLANGSAVIKELTEAALNVTLANIGLGELAPINTQDQIRGLDPVLLKIAFNHENRIRALENKAALTLAQFKTALRSLLA